MKKTSVVALFLFCVGNCFAGNSIPYPNSLQEANVSVSKMQDGQKEGFILGNGDLYGVVWEKDGSLVMRITKNDIWDARIDTSKDGELPRVDILTGKVSGPRGAPPSYDKLYPQPRCAVALGLGPASEITDRHLDLTKAVATIGSEGKIKTELRVLHDRNVLLIKSNYPVVMHPIKAATLPDATMGQSNGVAWLLMNMPGDIDYRGMDYAVAIATNGNLKAVSLVTSFDIGSCNVLEHAISLAKTTIAQREDTLVSEHEEAWQTYWSRSGVELEDKVLQRWWYRMLYFAGTVCKPGAAPVAIMPPLVTDSTPWHADFHHNYNTWQAYWPLPAANQPALADPWISYVNKMIPRFKFLAKETYGVDGVHVPISSFLHEPDPADCKSVNKRQMSMNPWGLTIGLQGMTLQSLWQKYLCDQDSVYMQDKIYPYLRETARFYIALMGKFEADENGKVLLGPSYSPEHGPVGIYNCPFDIAYVHYTFDAMIEAGTTLNADEELVEQCRDFKTLLADYPTAMDQDGNAVVVDWKGCRYKQVRVHNITVPASPVFPGDQVTWFSPEPEKELFRRTILDTRFNGNNSHVMFNIAKARLSMLEGFTDARKWFVSRELPNGFFVWKGHKHGTYMQEMIGVAGLINEYMLQSVHNKIRLFPCWPKGKDATFTGLRAQGGFIVSAEFKDGRVATALIKSVAEKELQLLSPWKTVYVNGKKSEISPAGLVILRTKPGQVFEFSESGIE